MTLRINTRYNNETIVFLWTRIVRFQIAMFLEGTDLINDAASALKHTKLLSLPSMLL